MTYAFLLGREPLLSWAELESVFGKKALKLLVSGVAFVETDKDPIEAFIRLGGSIKVGKVLSVALKQDFTKDPLQFLTNGEFLEQAFGKETSISIAVSFLGEKPKGLNNTAKHLGIEWKKALKEKYSHVRFVESRDAVTSSVTVKRNKLLRGCDLWIIGNENDVCLVKTIEVQDYQDFSERDFGRPRRNAKNGMLPPKLARMMVNISGADESSVLYDPFVGSGTVLQEALLVGVKKMYGSDIEEAFVNDAKKNLEWLSGLSEKKAAIEWFAASIETVDPKKVIDTTHLVAEIDLGNPLTGKISPGSAKKAADEASQLAHDCFSLIQKLPECASVVLALPFWPHREGMTITPVTIPADFKVAEEERMHDQFSSEKSSRGGMLYIRDDQFVGREILVLKRTTK